MSLYKFKSTRFMSLDEIENEHKARIDYLNKELRKEGLSSDRKKRLKALKNNICHHSKDSLADIVYASKKQEEISSKIKAVIENYKKLASSENLRSDDIYFITLNYCTGRGKNKQPLFLSPKQILDFDINKAKNTLTKQLHSLKNGFGFVAFEIKYDLRLDKFIPHFHILICGETKQSLVDLFSHLYPDQYKFRLNPKSFKIKRCCDPLIYERPQSIKIFDIRKVHDAEDISSYLCKFKTYQTNYKQRYLSIEPYRKTNKHHYGRPLPSIHNSHLLFLDKCSLSQLFYFFNKQLLTKFISDNNGKLPALSGKLINNCHESEKIAQKNAKHTFYKKPISNNNIVLKYFQYPSYRHPQEQIIDYMKKHQHALVIQPTNFGKSLCYYATALQLEGLCIVIEPLISLIYDQVSKLNKICKKLALAYTGETKNKDKKLKNLEKGKYKFLYISPEMLNTHKLKKVLSKLDISLIVIDEAHCIDLWGADFRPDYQKLNSFISAHPHAKVMALTATAGKHTQKIIKKVCNFPHNVKLFKGDLNRKNIKYKVVKKEGSGLQQLLNELRPYLDENQKPTASIIIYCAHIDYTLGLRDILKEYGINAYAYNGKISNKKEVLKLFKQDNCIIIATNAFGMGIDKPNVRLIIHFEGTDNLEKYYQESGRAGRDNKKAKALLFYCKRDITIMKHQIKKENKTIQLKFDEALKYMKMSNGKKRRRFLLKCII